MFAGGFTLEAAQQVAGALPPADVLPLLERLVDHHLVMPMLATHEPRFTMLETIREYGREHLIESGEEEEIRRRHAAYILQLVEQLDAFWAPYLPNAQQILGRLEAESANLRAALTWFRDIGGRREPARAGRQALLLLAIARAHP